MRTTAVFTALAAISIVSAAPGADIDAKSQKALDAAVEFHSGLDALHIHYKTITNISGMGINQEQIANVTIDAARPNSYSLNLEQDMMGTMQIISDGKQMFTYLGSPSMGISAYTQADAPADLPTLHEENEDLMTTGPAAVDAASLASSLFILPNSDAFFEDLQSATYSGVEDLQGVASHRIDAVFAGDFNGMQLTIPATIWIQQGDDPWIRGIDPDMSEMVEKMSAEGGMPPGMTFDVSQRLIESSNNPDFTDDTFAFTPPADAKKVNSLFDAFAAGPEAPPADGAPGENGHGDLIGAPAPSFSLDLLSGGTVNLAQHKGKDIVVLDFWATWCRPCVKALPTMVEVTNSFKDQSVVFYAVNLREDNDKINKFLEKKSLDTNILLDRKGNVAQLYAVQGIPQSVIIGKDGTVQAIHVGAAPNLKKILTGELQKLISGENLY